MSEPHAVVKLLLARMESHPEEFSRSLDGRWYDTIGEIRTWGNEADKAAIDAKLRDIRLNEAHEDAMDELCNGPERRRMQQEEAEYERSLYANRAGTQQVAPSRHPTFTDMENNGIVNTLRGILK